MSNLSNFLKSFENSDNNNDKTKANEVSDVKKDFNTEEANKANVVENNVTENNINNDNNENILDLIQNVETCETINNQKTDITNSEKPKKPTIKIKRIKIVRKVEKEPEQDQIPNIIKNDDNNNDNCQIKLEEMFTKSGTDEKFKEKWFELYQKSVESNKNTMTNRKIRNGKFRFDDAGKLEILPDFDTYGKSSKQLLQEQWNTNK